MNAGANDTGDSHGAPVVLITGAAKRLGAGTARRLHAQGWRIIVHCRGSLEDAEALAAELNGRRADSARVAQQALHCAADCEALAGQAMRHWQRIDALVNNASSFYRTPLGSISEAQWEDLIGSNLKVPLFLSQALAGELTRRRGAIVNMADVHGVQALPSHAPYGAAKAGLIMLTRILASELAPAVRVNAVAPGHILPASHGQQDADSEAALIAQIPLGKSGRQEDIANAVAFLLSAEARYVTGTVLPVDGGRLLGPSVATL